jgi:hypothetical protein
MSIFRTGDPLDDFHRQDMEQARREARLPVCENRRCNKRIHDEHYFEVYGEILCEDCMIKRHRRYTEDYIEID